MGKFTFTQTEIPGVVVIEPQVFGDDRGYFMETYQKDQFAEAGIDIEQVLEDISFNAGDENMPPFELTINGEYVQQHLSGENKPTDLRKYIL